MALAGSFEDTTLLIGLGPPRTGSRWLSAYLNKHSEVYSSPTLRVLHFFDAPGKYDKQFAQMLRESEARFAERTGDSHSPPPRMVVDLRERLSMNGDPGAYLKFFERRWSGERVFADVSPSYYIAGREAYARMRDVHPKVRFLLVLRNPIDRFWSEMGLARMIDATVDPYAQLDQHLAPPLRPWPATFRPHNYTITLNDLDATAPPANVRVCFFEEMFEPAAIGDLCEFLGVRYEPAELKSPLNQSGNAPLDMGRRAKLYAKFKNIYRFVHDRFAGRLPQSWLDDMERFGAA